MSGWLIGLMIFGIVVIFASIIILVVLLLMPSSGTSGNDSGNVGNNAVQRPPVIPVQKLPSAPETLVVPATQYVVTPMKFDTLKTISPVPEPLTAPLVASASPVKKDTSTRSQEVRGQSLRSQSTRSQASKSSWETSPAYSSDNYSDDYTDNKYVEPRRRNFTQMKGGNLTPFSDEISIMSAPHEDFSTSYSIDVDSPREVVKK